jgi:hypothetical protein
LARWEVVGSKGRRRGKKKKNRGRRKKGWPQPTTPCVRVARLPVTPTSSVKEVSFTAAAPWTPLELRPSSSRTSIDYDKKGCDTPDALFLSSCISDMGHQGAQASCLKYVRFTYNYAYPRIYISKIHIPNSYIPKICIPKIHIPGIHIHRLHIYTFFLHTQGICQKNHI